MKARSFIWTLVILGHLDAASLMPRASADGLIVHEWGTFTSIIGSNGHALEWTPYRGGAELPAFVYGGKHNATGTVRMETPVIYFYSLKELTCTVKVSFPAGQITEYYPMPALTTYPVRGVQWSVELLPGSAVNLPQERNANHYYHARETEAVPLRVWKGNVIDEYEKFLFYRGVGTFAMPLSVQVHADKVAVRQAAGEIKELIFFENRGGRTSCQRYGWESPDRVVSGPLPDCSVESLKRDLERLLVAHGLFPKEAEAMLKTWEGSWFEEGFRVFYVLPRQQSDTILPLEITPKPDKLVRVLVGRMEILTPDAEQEILGLLTRLKAKPETHQTEISHGRQRFGRFLGPMIREVLEKHPVLWDSALAKPLESLGVPAHRGPIARAER